MVKPKIWAPAQFLLNSIRLSSGVIHATTPLLDALKDEQWSWKDACEKVDFFSFDPCGTENDHLNEVKYSIWDTLFQGAEISEEE